MRKWFERVKSIIGLSWEQQEIAKRRRAFYELSEGERALFRAIENDNPSRIQQLFAFRNDIALMSNSKPFSARHFIYQSFIDCCRRGNVETLKTVLNHWPEVLDDTETKFILLSSLRRNQVDIILTIAQQKPELLVDTSTTLTISVFQSIVMANKIVATEKLMQLMTNSIRANYLIPCIATTEAALSIEPYCNFAAYKTLKRLHDEYKNAITVSSFDRKNYSEFISTQRTDCNAQSRHEGGRY